MDYRAEYKKLVQSQIESTEKSIKFCDDFIDRYTRQLQVSRTADRKLQEHIWSRGPLTMVDMMIFGSPKYEGTNTKKYKNLRATEYRRRKKYQKDLQELIDKLATL